jgi:hypothetical protein
MLGAAFSLLPVVQWAARELQRGAVEPLPFRLLLVDLAPPALVGTALLALWVTRAPHFMARLNVCVAGGLSIGVGSGGLLAARCTNGLGEPISLAASLLMGAVFGLVLGAACTYPVAQLAAARSSRAHATSDVQLGNTCAWIALLATGGFFAATTPESWWSSAALATASMAVALGARLRHHLRRRWLLGVMRGTVHGWAVERHWNGERSDDSPVLDLLEPSADEGFLVAVAPSGGGPYRGLRSTELRGRLAPDF